MRETIHQNDFIAIGSAEVSMKKWKTTTVSFGWRGTSRSRDLGASRAVDVETRVQPHLSFNQPSDSFLGSRLVATKGAMRAS